MSKASGALFFVGGLAVGLAVFSTIGFRHQIDTRPTQATLTSEKSVHHRGSVHRSGKVPIVPAGQDFSCTPTRVWDGDGPLWCAEGPRIRVAGIAARETDGSCRSNQPCPDATAKEARDQLVELVGHPTGMTPDGHVLVTGPVLKCHSVGWGKGVRTAAWCSTPKGVDLSCAMVETGSVLRWQTYWGRHRCA